MRYVARMMRNMLVRMIGLSWTRDSFSPTITFNTLPGRRQNTMREQGTIDKYTIRSIVCEASCHSVTQSLGHLVPLSLGHSVTRSLGPSVTRSLGNSVTRSISHTVTIFNIANGLTHNIRTYWYASQMVWLTG